MQQITSLSQMQDISRNWLPGKKIGFVPTMGYLHQGHLSLVAEAKRQCDICVVSIYVNPAQFGANEDLGSYPRDLKRDLEMLQGYEVDYVFLPTTDEMYPDGYKTWVEVDNLGSVLCGASRPGHFKGVATIVLKLVNLVKPHLMFMGEKDFQQIAVLRTMLKDLNLLTEIVPCPIVREADGLAMSSRNVYLNREERKQALCLCQAIGIIQTLYKEGNADAARLMEKARQHIENSGGRIDYIKLVDSNSLEEMPKVDSSTRIIMAVYIGKTRLIDNQPVLV